MKDRKNLSQKQNTETKQRLQLNRETLRALDVKELEQAAGGRPLPPTRLTCISCGACVTI